uniref:Uncharacterized protein n=1 Tax=Peronospora matthiolae TaxID=2874970 RepID=A0AAV1V4S2_9STRA
MARIIRHHDNGDDKGNDAVEDVGDSRDTLESAIDAPVIEKQSSVSANLGGINIGNTITIINVGTRNQQADDGGPADNIPFGSASCFQ